VDAVALGRFKGGKARARKLSRARRTAIAKKTVARWSKSRGISAEFLQARRQELVGLIAHAMRETDPHKANAAVDEVRLAELDLQLAALRS
jgi:hypothetical protein